MSQGPNGIQSEPDVVSRLYHIPLVQDSLHTFVGLVKSYSFTAFFYTKGENLAKSILNTTKPLQAHLPLDTLNSFANNCLDRAQAIFPRAFEIHADELFAQARKPADQAYEIFQQRVAASQMTIQNVQQRLSGLASNLPKSPEEGQKLLNTTLAEMDKTKDNLVAQAKELPTNVQARLQPLFNDLQGGLNEVSKQLSDTEKPLATRAQNAAQYIRDNTVPLLSKAKSVITESKANQASYAEAAAPN